MNWKESKIELVLGTQPRSKARYRLNQIELSELKKQLNKFLEKLYIRKNNSLFGIKVLFVSKNDRKMRMCIDYKALNKIIIKNNYSLLRVDDLLDRLNNSKYFNKINLKSCYYEISIVQKNIKKILVELYMISMSL